ITGPPVYAKKQFIDSFKKKWKSVFIKNKRFYAKAKRKITNFEQLLAIPKKTLREMKIKSVRIA
ncbi:MAG: hypothetical protein QXI41_02565, partial [Candidatus Pacearchaeota archaeon]